MIKPKKKQVKNPLNNKARVGDFDEISHNLGEGEEVESEDFDSSEDQDQIEDDLSFKLPERPYAYSFFSGTKPYAQRKDSFKNQVFGNISKSGQSG